MSIRAQNAMVSNRAAVLTVVREIERIYRANFDQSWFVLAVDGLPVDVRNTRDVHLLFQLDSLRPGDELIIQGAIRELDALAAATRTYVLPNLRDSLGISFFSNRRDGWNEQEYLVRQFHAYTFPHNLARLQELVDELRMLLDMPHVGNALHENARARA
jgi:hypothetical protein